MKTNRNIEFFIILIMSIAAGILFFKDLNKVPDIILASCSINSYINCAGAQASEISKIMGVPISFFGLVFSLLVLGSVTYTNTFKIYRALSPIILLNAVGSLFLLIYSLVVIKSLCPYCFIYQITSVLLAGTVLLSKQLIFDKLVVPFSIGLLVIFSGAIILKSSNNTEDKSSVKRDQELLISILNKKSKVGDPLVSKEFRLLSTTEQFLDAPIKISVFSDFQCPACKILAEDFKISLQPYLDKINLQYINYPLDSSCNENMAMPMHPQACLMSRIFICDPNKEKVHDYLFSIQKWVNNDELNKYIKDNGLESCVSSAETETELFDQIHQGTKVGIAATPTIIINGIKFEGLIKPEFLKMILEYYSRGN